VKETQMGYLELGEGMGYVGKTNKIRVRQTRNDTNKARQTN